MTRPVAECGTASGYQRHKRRGEPQCAPCLQAHSDGNRVSMRARNRALTRLTWVYPDEYSALYAQELARAKAEAAEVPA